MLKSAGTVNADKIELLTNMAMSGLTGRTEAARIEWTHDYGISYSIITDTDPEFDHAPRHLVTNNPPTVKAAIHVTLIDM